MKSERKYEIKLNETIDEFMDRCLKDEIKSGKNKYAACEYCKNWWHNSKSYSWKDDKFIYNSF